MTLDENGPTPGTDPAALPPLFNAGSGFRPSARNLAGPRGHTPTGPAHPTEASDTHAPAPEPVTHDADPSPGTGTAAPRTVEQGPVDWSLVRTLRAAVSDRIQEEVSPVELRNGLSRTRHEQVARSLVEQEIRSHNTRMATAGNDVLNAGQRTALTEAVLDAIFGLGRFEPLLRIAGREDIFVRGCDVVIVSKADGTRFQAPPVADTDQDLIADLQHLAISAGEKFSPADPQLDMPLPNGDRLSASAWFTPRPTVTIRHHGFVDIGLDRLVELGSMDQALAQFLSAATRAGISMVIGGLPASGKTTMIRALLNELPASVALATIEDTLELGLHNLPERHPNVWAATTAEGGENGVGEMTLESLVRAGLRQSVERIVVGEVRGPEILVMLEAMQAGKGSVSTVHAKNPQHTVDRLVNLALKAGPHISTTYAYRQIGDNIDLIVTLGVIDQTPMGGRKHRFVSHVDALKLGGDSATGIEHHPVFAPGPDGRAVPTGTKPDWVKDLITHGFDPGWLTAGADTYQAPLDLLQIPRRSA